jgi:hypothetical protein
MPPRGLENGSCDRDDRVRPGVAGTWLALIMSDASPAWTDRTRQIKKLREQGETLANIGRRFGLSAERVRQILLQEDQSTPNLVGAERALADDIESARWECDPRDLTDVNPMF